MKRVRLVGRCLDCKHYEGLAECEIIGACGGTDWFCGWFRLKRLPKYRCPLYAAFWNWFIPMSPHYEEWLTPMDWLRLKIGHRLPVPKRKEMGT